jgi:hypothetical protein
MPLRNILKSALKRSTTNFRCGRFRIPMRSGGEEIPMRLSARGALLSPPGGRGWVRGVVKRQQEWQFVRNDNGSGEDTPNRRLKKSVFSRMNGNFVAEFVTETTKK